MQTINWRGARLKIQSHNVQLGTQQLELKRCHRNATGQPVLLLAGFLGSNEVFLPGKGGGGLAAFLAALGYDVFLAELRGRGNSWPGLNDNADWGLHEAICEDIPAHSTAIAKLRPGESQFWLGQGLGSVLLTAAYVRAAELPVPILGMVHFAPLRRCNLSSRRKAMAYRRWSWSTAMTRLLNGYAAVPFSQPPRRETRRTLSAWKHWHQSPEWLDPLDGYDYGEALRGTQLPPSLYFANGGPALWGDVQDCRQWIQELGPHDARLITLGKAGGNGRDYSDSELLQHPAALDDHFPQLQAWLHEQAGNAGTPLPAAMKAVEMGT